LKWAPAGQPEQLTKGGGDAGRLNLEKALLAWAIPITAPPDTHLDIGESSVSSVERSAYGQSPGTKTVKTL
jgi:hypothetical protein